MKTLNVNQALRQVAALKGKLAEVDARMRLAVSYVEDQPPAFDFSQLREKRTQLQKELVMLQGAVANSNATTTILALGKTVAEILHELSQLKAEIAFYVSLPVLAQNRVVEEQRKCDYDNDSGETRWVMHKVTRISCMTEADKAVYIEELRDRFAALNSEVETSNHKQVFEINL